MFRTPDVSNDDAAYVQRAPNGNETSVEALISPLREVSRFSIRVKGWAAWTVFVLFIRSSPDTSSRTKTLL